MLKAIIFDFDGVIADSEPLHWRAFMQVVKPRGWAFDFEHYMQHYIGFDDRDAFREMFREHDEPLSDKLLHDLITQKAKAFAEIVREGITALPGAVELITSASQALPLAICSGALREDIDLILPGIGDGNLAECFQAVVTADDVTQSKPDPACYLEAARRLSVPAGECLAIEDTVTGLVSARDAGMKTLAVATTHPIDMLGDADCAVASLTQVTVDQLTAWFG